MRGNGYNCKVLIKEPAVIREELMRKTILITILILSLLLSLPLTSFAETYWGGELPNISDTELKAEVILDGEIYTYTYTIISGATNTGQIWSLI